MGISIFGNELPSWFTLGLVFCTFWLGVENILLFVCDSKKFGKGRKLSGCPREGKKRVIFDSTRKRRRKK